MEFQRPEGSGYPRIYETFKQKLKGSDEEEEFVIQDLTENFFDDAVDILAENHQHGAIFHMAAETLTTDEGRKYVKEKLLNTFKEKVSLICVKKETQEIVGLNCLYVRTSEDFMEPQVRIFFAKLMEKKLNSVLFIDHGQRKLPPVQGGF